jgi:phosphoglycerol transferase MdoB-like AlkP superfamily enzyme
MNKKISTKIQSVKTVFSKVKKQISKKKKAFSNKICKISNPLLQKISKKFPRTAKFIKKQTNWKNFNLLFGVFAIFVAGTFAAQFVFLKQFPGEETSKFMLEHPEITAYSSFIMLILMVLIFGIVGNVTWSIGIFYSLIIAIMFINGEKLASRDVPFMPEDLAMASEANSLSDMVNWGKLFSALTTIAVILIACFFINKWLKKVPHYKFSKRYKYLAQILIVAANWASLMYHTDFLRTKLSGQGTTVRVEWLDSVVDFTNQKYNYQTNGYIISTITAFQSSVINQPKGYSKEAVSKIIEKYSKLAQQHNSEKTSIQDEKVNIVYIMSESFVDPEKIKHIYNYGEKDPIPFTHSILQKFSSGQTAVAEYGGGTANVEFEALTGFSNYFLNGIPYTSLLPQNTSAPSIAKTLKQNNYSTTAIHPYRGTMYKRNTVYTNLGFENFIDIDQLSNAEKLDNSSYISDNYAFEKVFETLNKTEKSDFIHLVTMQNHMPYSSDIYNSKNFPVSNISGDENEARQWETYLEGINESDEALKKFFEKLQSFEEKTIVVFWGDHWPGIANALNSDENNKNNTQNTPLFIYSNFETTKNNLGTMSLNYLQTKVFDQVNAKISPFQALLIETSKQNPALTKKITTENSQALKDYEMIEYDILAGKKYSSGEFFEIK